MNLKWFKLSPTEQGAYKTSFCCSSRNWCVALPAAVGFWHSFGQWLNTTTRPEPYLTQCWALPAPPLGPMISRRIWLCCFVLEVTQGHRQSNADAQPWKHLLHSNGTWAPGLAMQPGPPCCSPCSSITGEVCLKTRTLLLWSQKRYLNTPTHLLQKQNWAEIFLWHLFSPFFSLQANEEFHVHIIVMQSSLISLCGVYGLNTQRRYIESHRN